MNERGRLVGEGSELMYGVLRGPKSAYLGCFSPSVSRNFSFISPTPLEGKRLLLLKLSARPIILEFIDVIVV